MTAEDIFTSSSYAMLLIARLMVHGRISVQDVRHRFYIVPHGQSVLVFPCKKKVSVNRKIR